MKTTALLAGLQASNAVVGGVNADFFSLANGTPVGALISRGRVVTGPYTQPVLAFDSTGAARALVLRVDGGATIGEARLNVRSWNRSDVSGVAFYDAAWGRTTDTATSVIEVVLDGRDPSRVVAIDTDRAGVAIPASGGVLVAGRSADSAVRARLLTLRLDDTVRVAVALAPFHPREAVGGRPMLARDSMVVPEVATEGQASFQARNPRTAAGIAHGGTRLILVVVDGRQKGYSDGMTLRETANLMLALGSRDAINLDGGGSSTLVYKSASGLRVANRTSDSLPNGAHVERAVGDALAIVSACGR
jgi:exopolysaccharide biosynthesis protein